MPAFARRWCPMPENDPPQLELALPKKKTKKPKPVICKCGHDKHKGPCACGCKRFKARGRVPVDIPEALRPPSDAIVLMSPDTKTGIDMGWAALDDGDLVVYISQLRTKRPNEFMRAMGVKDDDDPYRAKMMRRASMGIRMGNVRCRERSKSGVIQGIKRLLGSDMWKKRPTRLTVTRASSGNIGDDDGLIGALKFVRDGTAKALNIDDAEFSIQGKRPELVPVFYEQMHSGKPKVCGVFIEISWA